jgi:hypothetical protein
MNDPLAQLITFVEITARSWATTARTIVLLTLVGWLPLLALAAILIHTVLPWTLAVALTGGGSVTTAALLARRQSTEF